MCVRRWRPCDRCVSFHHYLQGSSGVPGRDGLKGEKVGKLQIKFSPQRKIWSCDVLSQFEHARQLVKIHFKLLSLYAIFSHVTLWILTFDVYDYSVICPQFFFFYRTCSKYCAESGKVAKCAIDMHIWWGLSLVKMNEAIPKSPHPLASLCYTRGQQNKLKVLKPPTSIHIYNRPLSSLPYWYWLWSKSQLCLCIFIW